MAIMVPTPLGAMTLPVVLTGKPTRFWSSGGNNAMVARRTIPTTNARTSPADRLRSRNSTSPAVGS